MEQTKIPIPIPLIKVEVSGGVVDLGTPKFNDVDRYIFHISIDFSSMEITEIYTIHSFLTA